MQNFRLTIRYDGTRYLGWQKPEKDGAARTVSYKITTALNRMTGEEITLFAGAKTDPGVHAGSQIINFETASGLSPEEIMSGLNQYLPLDISVLSAENAPERFRADLNAVSRTYECRICTARIYDVFRRQYESHCFPAPSVPLMEQAAAFLLGKHDFRAFSAGRKKKGTEKEILDIDFRQYDDRLVFSITANDYLQQMPALLAGTLLEIGAGRAAPGHIADILSGKEKAGPSAEAKSLCLTEIKYV